MKKTQQYPAPYTKQLYLPCTVRSERRMSTTAIYKNGLLTRDLRPSTFWLGCYLLRRIVKYTARLVRARLTYVPDRVWIDNDGEWRQAFPQIVEDAGLLAWIGGVVCLGAWLMGVL